ncbi:MAG: hypothetical protein AB1390_02595 [Nitrospirota bacterium]
MLKNKKLIYILPGLAFAIFLLILAEHKIADGKKQINSLRQQYEEMMILQNEFLSLKRKIDVVERKKNLSNVQGVGQAVEEVFLSIGLKDKIKALKSTTRRETMEGVEEEADVSIEKVDMNELVNIFYRIENAPMILTVKKVTIKKSFEDPELLNVSLVLSFLKIK